MARISFLFFASVVALMAVQCRCHYSLGKEKVTNLHFFFHDTLSGENPSAVLVASAHNLSSHVQQASFGNVWVFDDPLTEGPEPDSEVVGSAQGLYMSSGRETPTLVLGADYGFTAGPYKGSSFSVFSRNPVMETERELAVVGGRGAFRMAQGVASLRTYSVNLTTGDAVVEYNVTLLHYE